MADPTIHVAVLVLEIYIPAAQSLKEKRRVLKSLKDRVRGSFNVSVAEIGELEKWQRAMVGFSALSADKSHLNGTMNTLLDFAGEIGQFEIIGHDLQFL